MPRTLLGTRIRENRRSKRISQAKLAQLAGISASYLNLIEHNRRGIGGKTLIALAKALDVDPREFSEGADQALVGRVKQAAANAPTITCEIDRTEEFIARFPGYARLIGRQYDTSKMQTENIQAMSDRLKSDPFFAEAMHLMLSNITTIRSTAEILSDTDDIGPELHKRFISNLQTEAQRLSQTAEDILAYFEPGNKETDEPEDGSAIEAIFEAHDYFLPALEDSFKTPVDLVEDLELSKHDELQTVSMLADYQSLANKLPLQTFLKAAELLKFDPFALSTHLNVSLATVLKRFAHLPNQDDVPRFGLLECDGSGAVKFRKQLPTLALPRFNSACPLWPIYRGLSQPNLPIKAFINMPTGERFLTFSIAEYVGANQIGMPAQTSALMAFTPDYELMLEKTQLAGVPNLAVGLQCSVCPRDNCAARRAKYLLQ